MSSRLVFEARRRWQFRSVVFSCGLLFLPAVGWGQRTPTSLPSAPPVPPARLETGATPLTAVPLTAADAPAGPVEKNAFEAISREVQAIFAKCKGAVVRIEATDAYGMHSGTGFFIDPAGTIYTHYSVAGRSWNLLVEFAGKKYPATCLLADARSGVALLNIKAGETPFLPIGKSADLRVASAVMAIGYPMDLPESPTFGLVAGFDQKFFDHYLSTTHIRANVPVQAGESGSPLLNDKGEVVGILMCQFDFGAVCLSLPIQAAEKMRSDYLRFGKPRPGWIGVVAKPTDGDDDRGAVCVESLAESSPAALPDGLKVGDTLLKVGHTPVHRFADLRDASFFLTADEMVPMLVQRDGAERTIYIRASDPPGESMSLPPARESETVGERLTLPLGREYK